MDLLFEITGRRYNLFDYYGDENAKNVIVMMGSGVQTVKQVINYINSKGNEKVGVVMCRLYRPWSEEAFLKSLPKSVENICVLDRVKEPGSVARTIKT